MSAVPFKSGDEALETANDTLYRRLGVWTRNHVRAYRFGRSIQAGRVGTNCYLYQSKQASKTTSKPVSAARTNIR